jgi:hypothetical protein
MTTSQLPAEGDVITRPGHGPCKVTKIAGPWMYLVRLSDEREMVDARDHAGWEPAAS